MGFIALRLIESLGTLIPTLLGLTYIFIYLKSSGLCNNIFTEIAHRSFDNRIIKKTYYGNIKDEDELNHGL